MENQIKTPETHPNHDTVGHHFASWDGKIYYCDSYDSRIGFWMTNAKDATDRKNVSERAIGRTFHKATDRGDHWCISSWGTKKEK